MTKLQPAVLSDNGSMSLDQEIHLNLRKETRSSIALEGDNENEFSNNNADDDDEMDDIKCGPLGYQNFLYDVNFEFSPGGDHPNLTENRYCFKMKCLPYMIGRGTNDHKSQMSCTVDPNVIDDSNQSSIDRHIGCLESYLSPSRVDSPGHIDVIRATCAFLGNSEYVPSCKFRNRRVVLELISAKLSQSSHYITPNSSFNNLVTLNEDSLQQSHFNNRSPVRNHQTHRESATATTNQIALTSQQSSKRFVNYTILIKTAPGLDKHPAVIERRFSDFLQLYQGLKIHRNYAKIVDRHVSFPKKIYMGNFSLAKIAERSIEFARLLSLCMRKVNLLWSVPFISFLIDKELKDAHRLALFGDPDDVQALIETAFFIEQKLYLIGTQSSSDNNSSYSYDLSDRYSPILPNGRSFIIQSPSNETISANSSPSSAPKPSSTDHASNSDQSFCDTSDDSDSIICDRTNTSSLNQRILVTFCIIFVVYCRGNNHSELKQAVQRFNQLISSQDYVDSVINTRHYKSLRACLLFLMNLNRGDVIEEKTRLWFKRRLEDIDAAHAELDSVSMTALRTTNSNNVSVNDSRNRKYHKDGNVRTANHVSKNDLTSLLRDRNFCSFQDGKFNH